MEKAIYYSKLDNLKSHDLYKSHYNDYAHYDRIYFGNEFCDELMPSLIELQEAVSLAIEKKKPFSFMTCYVNEHKINRYYQLLEFLAKKAPNTEVIINDWGVLKICLKNDLKPVLGRLLVRQKRDPRIADFICLLPETAKLRLQQAGLNDYFLDFLKTQKIDRIELDNLLQGLDISDLNDKDFSYSVYVPYGYITTTRLCFFRSKNKDSKEKFSITSCAYECRQGLIKLYNQQMKRILLMKGNTIFFKNTSESFLKTGSRINRIVYEPEIPD